MSTSPTAPAEQEPVLPPDPVRPVPPDERVDTIDVLRGFALLGILLVNIEFMRGSGFWALLSGDAPAPAGADRVVGFLIGWLASGKFFSCFALLFGVGAAIMAARAERAGVSANRLLRRRYGWLLVIGLAHMSLLFFGDILFFYGLVGLLLLLFTHTRPRVMLWWSAGLLAVLMVLLVGLAGLADDQAAPAAEAGEMGEMIDIEEFFGELGDKARAAYRGGSLGQRAEIRAWEIAIVQGSQLLVLPLALALFLFGFALGKTGFFDDLGARRRQLRLAAAIGLGGGLILNAPLGLEGVLGGSMSGPSADATGPLLMLMMVAQMLGAPLLAIGYLSALTLACQRPAVLARLRWLRDAGRMALSGYVLQSLLAAIFFAGLGFYDRLSYTESLAVVAAIWAAVLAASTLWLRRFSRGPLEHLWRRLTYGSHR